MPRDLAVRTLLSYLRPLPPDASEASIEIGAAHSAFILDPDVDVESVAARVAELLGAVRAPAPTPVLTEHNSTVWIDKHDAERLGLMNARAFVRAARDGKFPSHTKLNRTIARRADVEAFVSTADTPRQRRPKAQAAHAEIERLLRSGRLRAVSGGKR